MASSSGKPNKAVGIKTEVLNDLASRFLINLSEDDRSDLFKLCSQVELAYWFYLDLVRPEDPSLPACSFKEFLATVFDHCPFLVNDSMGNNLDSLISHWKTHKYKKPVRGAIILNPDLTQCLLVQGWPASTSWGFPKGKLEEGEDDVDTAVREVYEETGFDSREIIRRDLYLECTINDSHSRMYIIPGVPESTHFEPKTRKEIRAIQWFNVSELPVHRKDISSKLALKNPNNFFLIIPFVSKLRKWISSRSERKNKRKAISASFNSSPRPPHTCQSSLPVTANRHTSTVPLLPTPHHVNSTAPIPYPAPPPHTTPHTHYTLPAPLQQSLRGQFYQGTVQYTAVYPPHIAYPNMPSQPSSPHTQHYQPTPNQRPPPLRPPPLTNQRPPLLSNQRPPVLTNQVSINQYRPVRDKGRYGNHDMMLSPSLIMTKFQFNKGLIKCL